MFTKPAYFCVLALLSGIMLPHPVRADIDVTPVPFDAQAFAERIAMNKDSSFDKINVKTLSNIEPASGGESSKSPQPYYMVTIDSIPVETLIESQNAPAPADTAAATPTPQNDQSLINTGQKIKISVKGEPDLTSVYLVKPDGKINFPLIGKVEADKSTPGKLAENITAKLKDGFLVAPEVKVERITADPIFVLGDVNAPGKPIYSEKISIASAIVQAGGYEKTAKKINDFEVLRTKDPETGLFKASADSEVLVSGDVLIVKGY